MAVVVVGVIFAVLPEKVAVGGVPVVVAGVVVVAPMAKVHVAAPKCMWRRQ